jgi:prepilin-type N-terminal cleavage/methylation domain-containing protein
MLPSTASKHSSGFTLAELLVVFIIFGVLTALLAPNFVGMRNRYQVNDAFDQTRQVFREAQQEAIKQSRTCTISLNVASNPVTITAKTADNTACVINRVMPSGIQIKTNSLANPPTIGFSYRGNTVFTGGSTFTAVVYHKDTPNVQKKCLVLSGGIGIMRSGNYTGSVSGSDAPVATSCATSP